MIRFRAENPVQIRLLLPQICTGFFARNEDLRMDDPHCCDGALLAHMGSYIASPPSLTTNLQPDRAESTVYIYNCFSHFTPVLKSYGCAYACVLAQVDPAEAVRGHELGQLQLHQPKLGRTVPTATRRAAPCVV